MTEPKYTPGPWFAEPGGCVVVDSREQVCCGHPHPADGSCCGSPDIVGDYFEVAQTSEQDAHLIAAAPEMLETLDAIVLELMPAAHTNNMSAGFKPLYERAKAVVEKARSSGKDER